jgi:hypothetical protein
VGLKFNILSLHLPPYKPTHKHTHTYPYPSPSLPPPVPLYKVKNKENKENKEKNLYASVTTKSARKRV